ncbi:GNAT family N-acetyltransferase [Thalassiella azotivora]
MTADQLGQDELLRLYSSVGWGGYTADPATLGSAVRNSAYLVAARDDGRLVGLARVVSDDATVCYLQDLLVDPTHQRRGVGRRLVQAVVDRYAHVRQKVLLTDDEPGQHAFYEALGYCEVRAHGNGSLRAFVRYD